MTLHVDNVTKIEKIIGFLILLNIVIGACDGFYLFTAMDGFMSKKYEKTYTTWRNKEMGSL